MDQAAFRSLRDHNTAKFGNCYRNPPPKSAMGELAIGQKWRTEGDLEVRITPFMFNSDF